MFVRERFCQPRNAIIEDVEKLKEKCKMLFF